MSRKPAPTGEQIDKAVTAAQAGRGRQLALLLKSFSMEDLAAAFSFCGRNGFHFYNVGHALNFAAGRKGYREENAKQMRGWRKQRTGDEE